MTRNVTKQSVSYDFGFPTFYYKNGLSGLGANYADDDYPVENILDPLENNIWKSTTYGSASDIYYDAGGGARYGADYLGINGHNFASADVAVSLECSNDTDLSSSGNSGDEVATISAPDDDFSPLVVEFDFVMARYWRMRLTPSGSVIPKIMNGWWGPKTVLDFATVSTDPNQSKYDGVELTSETGVILASHLRSKVRTLNFSIGDTTNEIYAKARSWFDNHGFQPFFVSWNYPNDIFYMRNNNGEMFSPYRIPRGEYRNLSFDLIGRDHPWL